MVRWEGQLSSERTQGGRLKAGLVRKKRAELGFSPSCALVGHCTVMLTDESCTMLPDTALMFTV